RVDDHPARPVQGVVTPGDEKAFHVGVAAVGDQLQLTRPFVDAALEQVQGQAAVEIRVAPVEDVEVDPVEDGHAHARTLFGYQLVERGANLRFGQLDPRHRLSRFVQQDEAG